MSNAAERLYERVLVVRCQNGDETALAELIALYSPRLRFYLRKMAGESAADDLLQEVWIALFANVTSLNDPGAFAGWIYRIARDKAWRELRRRRIPCVAVDDGLNIPADDAESEWTAEDVQRVRLALDELPADQREVLVLRFVEAMSYEQIAAVVDRPVGTVRSRLHYAKSALRKLLERTDSHERTRIR